MIESNDAEAVNMMQSCEGLPKPAEMAFETWMSSLHALGCHYSPEDIDPKEFAGWIRSRVICGFEAIDVNCNAPRIERTVSDLRSDGDEHFYALFQFAGRSTMIQNDQVVELGVGDIALVDSARPVSYFSDKAATQWLALRFPRRSLLSHLGSEPLGGMQRSGRLPAVRALSNLVTESAGTSSPLSSDVTRYMNLAIYDLLGALFANSNPATNSRYSDKLFARICDVVTNRFSDPEIGPLEIANEAGVSLRYLQKLFAARGMTCTQHMQLVRLNHAARLLRSRTAMKGQQSLSEIAFESGFFDYNNFGRAFRRHFGFPPSAIDAHQEN